MHVLIPPCHPRKASVLPLTRQQLAEAIPITTQVAHRLNKRLTDPISLQYIHQNYHVVKQADLVMALTCFAPERKVCMGGTGWGVEMAKVLNKVLYVYDVEQNIWFWYNPKEDFFYACEQMSEEQYALPTLVQKTAILSYHIKTARMSRNFVTHLSYYLFYKKDSVRYGHSKENLCFLFHAHSAIL